jgi:hypothetical protein
MALRVLPDANVLYSRTLRDWLLLLDLTGAPFMLCWTEDVLAEVMYRLRRAHPRWDGRTITQIRDRLCRALEGRRIDDYPVDGTFAGADPDDQHVDAAARAGAVDVVLTHDTGFTVAAAGSALPYRVLGADDFLLLVEAAAPECVRAVAVQQATYWAGRPGSEGLDVALVRAGCPRFAVTVRRHLTRTAPGSRSAAPGTPTAAAG